MHSSPAVLIPEWPAPANVRAVSTQRVGGVSQGVYAALNLATHVGDDAAAVARNRANLRRLLPAEPVWLEQIHGADVLHADTNANANSTPRCADASVTQHVATVCVVMTADCLPVLFCDRAGTRVGAAHAGWKGLAAGVLENTVEQMACAPASVMAWLGPAISQPAFEVGDEVRQAFVSHLPACAHAFVPGHVPGKWLADLYALARIRLAAIGVTAVYGGGRCTWGESDAFFSARRDGTRSGRQASLIWLAD